MKLAKIFIVLTFLLTFTLNVSAQKSGEPCSNKIDYVNRNQVDPPMISLRGIKGQATDLNGVAIPEICVALFTEKGHQFVAQTISDANGYFSFGKIPNGHYRLVGRVLIDYFCPVNVRIRQTNLSRRKRLILNMRGAVIDACSYGDTK